MKLIILLTLISLPVFAQTDAAEESIILNQEMQFLEESAKNITAVSKPLSATSEIEISDTAIPRKGEMDLERSYFSDDETDSIRTRTAAPKRRILR